MLTMGVTKCQRWGRGDPVPEAPSTLFLCYWYQKKCYFYCHVRKKM